MIKIFFLLYVLFSSLFLFSQSDNFGVNIGTGYSHTYTITDTIDTHFGLAAKAGISYRLKFKSWNFLTGVEMLTRQQKASVENKNSAIPEQEFIFNRRFYSVSIPLMLEYPFFRNENFDFGIKMGGRGEFLITDRGRRLPGNILTYDLPDSLEFIHLQASKTFPVLFALAGGIYYERKFVSGNSLGIELAGNYGLIPYLKVLFQNRTLKVDPDPHGRSIYYTEEDQTVRSRGSFVMLQLSYNFNLSSRKTTE